MSNEIIERCCNTVQLQDVFDGKVDIVMPLLKQSIASGESWKEIYHKTARSIAKYDESSWEFDESRIFAQMDAFTQRCRDLLEVSNHATTSHDSAAC